MSKSYKLFSKHYLENLIDRYRKYGEEGLTATLTYWMVAHQTKVHGHLMKREKPFHTSELAVFKRNSKYITRI